MDQRNEALKRLNRYILIGRRNRDKPQAHASMSPLVGKDPCQLFRGFRVLLVVEPYA